jgi:hypothetical protein
MEKRILKCALIGGLTVFIWGFISWAILPWHEKTFNQFKDEKKVYEALKDNAPVSGIYILPNMYASSKGMSSSDMRKVMESRQQMMVNGPVMFASVCREGLDGNEIEAFYCFFDHSSRCSWVDHMDASAGKVECVQKTSWFCNVSWVSRRATRCLA